MRVILLLPSNHVYANFIARETIKGLKDSIVMIVESDTLIPGNSFWNSVQKYVSTSGFEYFFSQAIKQGLFISGRFVARHLRIPEDQKNVFYSYKEFARRYNIPLVKFQNINTSSAVRYIREMKPDLIVSIYFRNILQDELLHIPARGCINIHPAMLPFYRGISPVFWALAEGEKNVGVTIHFMEKGIDRGDIIIQRSVAVREKDDEHSLFMRCSSIAIPMLLEKIKEIEDNSLVTTAQKEDGSYFSLPTKKAVRAFKKRGHRFFKIKDFLNAGVSFEAR